MDNGNAGGETSRFSRRQEPSATATLVLVVVALAIAYGGFRAWSWWQGALHAPANRGTATFPAAKSVSPKPTGTPVVTAPAVQPPPDRAAVVKCVVKGVTTYATSAADCPAGAEITRVAIDPKLNLSAGLQDAPAIIRAPSAGHTETSLRTTTAAAEPIEDRKAVCLALEAEIKAIDAHARQPLPGQEQDRLAALRKKARDAQFRLRC